MEDGCRNLTISEESLHLPFYYDEKERGLVALVKKILAVGSKFLHDFSGMIWYPVSNNSRRGGESRCRGGFCG